MMLLHLLCAAAAASAAQPRAVTPTVPIAPGVDMPVVNLGGVASRPSNYSAFLSLGGVGLDTAYSYTTQPAVGEAIRRSGLPRNKIFVTTKVPCCPIFHPWTNPVCNGASPANTSAFAEDNLHQLGLEYVDLLLMHWYCDTWEQTVQTWRALEQIQASGKARAIGISNFNASLVKQLLGVAKVKPAVNQCGYSIGAHNGSKFGYLGRDDETREFCTKNGVTYQAYSPLGGLSGVDVLSNPVVKGVASAHNVSTAQVALRWVAQQESIFVTAADNPEYIKEDLDIFSFELTDDEMLRLAKV